MEPRKKPSVRSYGSGKERSRSGSFDQQQEEEPILGDGDHDERERREVVVKIDGNSHNPFVADSDLSSASNSTATSPRAGAWAATSAAAAAAVASPRTPPKVWRDGSYEFWKDGPVQRGGGGGGGGGGEGFSFKSLGGQPASPQSLNPVAEGGDDPPTRLIGSFLRKQAASGGEVSLDLDLEMEELKRPAASRTPTSISASRELRVSFQDPQKRLSSSSSSSSSSSDVHRDGRKGAPGNAGDEAEVLRCTSTSYQLPAAGGPLLRAKTRSRLIDPPPLAANTAPAAMNGGDDERKSFVRGIPKSGQLRSGLLGKSGPFEEEDDDPFMDEDIPADFKRGKLDALTILQWASLVLIVAALLSSLLIPRMARLQVLGLHLWKWEILVLVLICGRLVSGWVIRIAVFCIERNFLLRKRVLYFVYGVRRAVQNALWLGLALASWHFLFKNVAEEVSTPVLPYVTKVLFCLLVATLVRLVKTLLLKVLASSFHVSTYFDRIQEALFNQYVIETLSGPPLVDESRMLAEVQELQRAGATIPNELRATALPSKAVPPHRVRLSGALSRRECSKQLQKDKVDEGITIDQLHRLNQKNISAWNMKRLMKIVRYGTLTTMDEQIKQATGEEDESAMHIRSEYEAKIAAKRIFHNVAKTGSRYIYLSDLMRFMRQEEAFRAMNLFEGAQEHNRVSKRSLKNWVVNAFRERKALALTLNDTKTAVNKLHQMANVVVCVIVFALWLLILGIATTHFFVFLSSQLLVAVFMFGNTLKTIFEAIVFLFVMHPFDVGDRCEIEGVQVVVEEMNIMTTIFLRYDNLKIYYPNSVLATKPIMNYYRSPDMGEAIDFAVHVATPVEKLALMKERILHYIDNKKDHWYPGAMIVLRDVDSTNKLTVSIWFCHRINFQDMGMRFVRRELVLQEMIKVLKDLDIEYRMLPLDVNIRNVPPITSMRMPSTWTTFTA